MASSSLHPIVQLVQTLRPAACLTVTASLPSLPTLIQFVLKIIYKHRFCWFMVMSLIRGREGRKTFNSSLVSIYYKKKIDSSP